MDNKLLKPISDDIAFDKLFRTYKKEAFRLETLPEYRVECEDGELEYFLKHKKLSPIASKPTEWSLMAIEKATKRGALNWRIRRLSKNLTDYERWEVEGYKVYAPLGFKVWAFTREFDDMPELKSLPVAMEYWMFDEKTIILVEYDLTGQYLGSYQYLGDPKPYIALKNKLKRISKRLV